MKERSKKMIIIVGTVVGFILQQAQAQDGSSFDASRAVVNLPYEELRKLWQAANEKSQEKKPDTPPLKTILDNEIWELRLETKSKLTATFTANVLAEGWQSVPLADVKMRLLSHEVGVGGGQLAVKEEKIVLLTKKAGQKNIRVSFLAPSLPELMEGEKVEIFLGEALRQLVKVVGIPKKYNILIDEKQIVPNEKGEADFFPTANKKSIKISLTKKSEQIVEKKLPQLKIERLLISSVKARTRMTPQGASMTVYKATLRHANADKWRLSLPAGAKLLTGNINNIPVDPAQRKDGTLEFALPQHPNQHKTKSEIELAYTVQLSEFDAVGGNCELALPLTAVFIDQIDWQLDLPESYLPTAVAGNLEIQKSTSTQAICLKKQLCRNEQPRAEFFYQHVSTKNN